MNWKLIVLLAMMGYGAYQHFSHRPIVHGNGVIASVQPEQSPTSEANLTLNGYNHSI